jgi:hypothetical protein
VVISPMCVVFLLILIVLSSLLFTFAMLFLPKFEFSADSMLLTDLVFLSREVAVKEELMWEGGR